MFGFGGNKDAEATPAQQTNPNPSTPAQEPELTGLDRFQKMIYPDKKDGEGDNSDSAPSAPVDPTKIFEDQESIAKVMSSVDFTKSISSDTQKLLESNDPKGFTSMVNDISKAAFLESLKLSSHLNKQTIEDAVQRALKQSKGQIDESLGEFQLNQAMPELQNPVIRLGLDAIKTQLKAQNPSMSPSDLAKELRGFLKDANSMVNPDKQAAGNKAEAETSWEDWLNS